MTVKGARRFFNLFLQPPLSSSRSCECATNAGHCDKHVPIQPRIEQGCFRTQPKRNHSTLRPSTRESPSFHSCSIWSCNPIGTCCHAGRSRAGQSKRRHRECGPSPNAAWLPFNFPEQRSPSFFLLQPPGLYLFIVSRRAGPPEVWRDEVALDRTSYRHEVRRMQCAE